MSHDKCLYAHSFCSSCLKGMFERWGKKYNKLWGAAYSSAFCLVAVNDPKITPQLFNSWTAIWISRMKVPCGSLGRGILGRVAFGCAIFIDFVNFHWEELVFCLVSERHKEEDTMFLLSEILRISLEWGKTCTQDIFPKKTYVWMAYRHMKRCLTSLIIREMQVRTTSVRIAVIKMIVNNMLVKMWRKGKPGAQLLECKLV